MSADPPVSDDPPPVRGLARTTWDNRGQLIGWDAFAALVVAVPAVIFVHASILDSVLGTLLTAEFGLIGAVLGVVVAGLAIVVAFLSREYASVIVRSGQGAMGDFWPFWFVAAVAGSAVAAAGAGLVLTAQVPCLSRAVFGVTTFLSSYAIFGTINLVAYVAHQGETRAWQLAQDAARDSLG